MLRVSIGCAVVLALLAGWGISDVVHGEAGLEDLVLTLPLLVISLTFAAIMMARLRRLDRTPTDASPLEAAAGVERMWRYAKWCGGGVSLLIVLSMSIWGARSRSVWTPALVGGFAILGTWIGMAVFFRPKRRAG